MTRRGFSLHELLTVCALTALVSGMAFPALKHAMDRRAVEEAARIIILAHREGRYASIALHRTTLLRLAPDMIELRAVEGRDTTLLWRRPGPATMGVTVTGNAHTVRFIPYGYSIGASNSSYTISRGVARRRVVISRLGRVRVE
jgi:Tfp pilus assembly protein FimT